MPQDVRLSIGDITLAGRKWPADDPASPPLLLLPATGETAADWDQVALALSASRTVFALNLRGHGASDWPGTYSIQLMADDIIGALNSGFFGSSVDLVGHSLGGLVACAVAAARPDHVQRLVLEDIGLLHPRPPDPPERPEGTLDFDWCVVEQVRPEIDRFDPRWADVVATIGAPTLILTGGPTSPIPRDRIDDLARRIPHSTVITIDAGHLIHNNEPAAFVDSVLSFLNA